MTPRPLELLAPARNADFGIEAVLHGADAVYIGGPSFGARAQAGNSLADIARLVAAAHRYRARVFVAVNTLLHDDELEAARRLIWELYEAGADAVILQDMGLLEVDLPPIELHASTQTDIRSPAKAAFLDQVGFAQIVLARELDLGQIEAIAAATRCRLEFFVHGALCVAYSGQCYISHAHTGRSANRGECSQACRLPYDLVGPQGERLASNRHLLSMKDNDQSANLLALAEAGISAFKIEGRLKDLAYVKNITAHYRQKLDAILDAHPERFTAASSGRCTYTFTPRPEKSFNRGHTDYFVHGRQADIGAFATPAFAGEPIGSVLHCDRQGFTVETSGPLELHNGDGLAYFDATKTLRGLRLNTASRQGAHWRCIPLQMPDDLVPGTRLFRNHDQHFVRQLEQPSAERRIDLELHLLARPDGLRLEVRDSDGIGAHADLDMPGTPARDVLAMRADLVKRLGKLGNTSYRAARIGIAADVTHFWPTSALNALRRDAVAALEAARAAAYRRPPRKAPVEPAPPYPESALSYLGNVLNRKADAFYRRHGVTLIAAAYEANQEAGEVSLMITRHCLRYSFNLCPKEVKGIRPEPLTLQNGKEKLTLVFDCKKCEMHVRGRSRQTRVIPILAAPA